MNDKLMPISFSQAWAIAEQHARADLDGFIGSSSPVLNSEYLEADHCWMFFRNDEIDVPADATLGMKWAYVVSKKGTYSMVQDFSNDQQKTQAYLKTLSDHFEKPGE